MIILVLTLFILMFRWRTILTTSIAMQLPTAKDGEELIVTKRPTLAAAAYPASQV